MYLKYLFPAGFIGQAYLNMHFQSAWSKNGLINQILPVGHADDYNIIQSLHTIQIGQQLIDDIILCS